ncbi:hypothetical protein [Peribacillus sp. SCS-37]
MGYYRNSGCRAKECLADLAAPAAGQEDQKYKKPARYWNWLRR